MSDQSHDAHGDGEHEDHGGYGLYIQVALALVFLTAASYWTFTPLWPFGESVEIKRLWMMAVSCSKASLVIMIFMHLWWEANWKWVLTVPASFMCVFLVLMLVPDVGMRVWNGYSGYSRDRFIYAAEMPIAEESHDGHSAHSQGSHEPLGDGHEHDAAH